MGKTTFSGPVLAGGINETTGSTLGANVKNTGHVTMVQGKDVAVTGATANTNIAVIPANSQIVDIKCLVTTAFDNGTNTLDVGIASDTDLYVDGMNCAAVGLVNMTAATTGTEANWKNVGTSDVTIVFISPGTGNGAGVLTVEYIQNRNL